MNYTVTVKQGVSGWLWLLLAFLLLPVPAIVRSLQAAHFESTRWAESDYGSPFSSSSEDE